MPTAIAAGVVLGTAASTGCRIYVILRKNDVEQVSRNSLGGTGKSFFLSFSQVSVDCLCQCYQVPCARKYKYYVLWSGIRCVEQYILYWY